MSAQYGPMLVLVMFATAWKGGSWIGPVIVGWLS